MPKIFISYRRADSRKDAGRLYDRLVEAFGKDNIFKDVDNIPMGKDFRGVLREAVAQCDVLLAVIGKQWMDITDEHGNRRLDNPGDFVRIEIESALQRDSCLVVPVLVDNAPMPRADDLPLDLRELAFNNARLVRDDPDFHSDVSRIVKELQPLFDANTTSATTAPSKPPTYDVPTAIRDFFQVFEEKQWERAREILAEIRASGRAPRVFNVDTHEKEVWDAIEAEERDNEYAVLQLMAGRSKPTQIWDSLQVFWQSYPDYDPDNLARFKPAPSPVPIRRISPLPTKGAKAILPAPFDWIDIPAGKVKLITAKDWRKNYIPVGKSQNFDVPSFTIAKYPITNAQFAKFVNEAKGYTHKKWWTEAGWAQLEKDKWTEPRFWTDEKWNGAEQPVIGVSWYEAAAFCLWLSEASGEMVMLPSEQQWQFAAQGIDGRAFPWGDVWDGTRCNNSVDPFLSNNLTPVSQFEDKGSSPFGLADMIGNVWEWCRTDYQIGVQDIEGTNIRVLRGGSWFNSNANLFRCNYRHWNIPSGRDSGWGFRISRS